MHSNRCVKHDKEHTKTTTGLPSMAQHQPIDSSRMESKVTEIAGMLENKFRELLSKRIIEQT